MTRHEKDYLGKMALPDDAYYGIQTARAVRNFPVTGMHADPALIWAYLILKKAAAQVNMELGELDRERGKAIVWAVDDALKGHHLDQFVVDVFQAGAGTSFNMNVNEVLANLALEQLGEKRGDYRRLSPNDHVNMGQSTNDTYPTASHLAILLLSEHLLGALEALALALEKKGKENSEMIKTGRTHLMDALPVTLGQEFLAYGTAVRKAMRRIQQRRSDLLELPLGGTAVGTGVGAHPRFRSRTISRLAKATGWELSEARDSFEALQSRSGMVAFSGSLRELAIELVRIANDLRLLASGPLSGLGEIRLPAVQPGSSIMPGKVNPSIPECLDMICFQVMGNDLTVSMAGHAGQLELNVMTPLMTYDILASLRLLDNFLPVFTTSCIEGIEAEEKRCLESIEYNPILATLLNREIGYVKASELSKESLRTRRRVKDIAIERGYITQERAEELFDPNAMAKTAHRRKRS
jgi:aspartate ammonia-lyase